VYTILLEKAARVQLLACLLGRPLTSPAEEIPLKIEQIYHPDNLQSFFTYYARRLGRREK
jgi:ribulose-5-phosphate 4-epimerase/fuculose-1-phosphate aldolase